jgi:hypothetical protein
MRVLLKASMNVEMANATAKENRLGQVIKMILDDLKPEAVYFTAEYGMRTAYVFLDLPDASQIPKISEPWMLAFDSHIELVPVMVPDDLMKAGPDIERAAEKYG